MKFAASLHALPIHPRFVSDFSGAQWTRLPTIDGPGDERDWVASEVRSQPGDPIGCRVFQLAPLNHGGFRDEPGVIFVAG